MPGRYSLILSLCTRWPPFLACCAALPGLPAGAGLTSSSLPPVPGAHPVPGAAGSALCSFSPAFPRASVPFSPFPCDRPHDTQVHPLEQRLPSLLMPALGRSPSWTTVGWVPGQCHLGPGKGGPEKWRARLAWAPGELCRLHSACSFKVVHTECRLLMPCWPRVCSCLNLEQWLSTSFFCFLFFCGFFCLKTPERQSRPDKHSQSYNWLLTGGRLGVPLPPQMYSEGLCARKTISMHVFLGASSEFCFREQVSCGRFTPEGWLLEWREGVGLHPALRGGAPLWPASPLHLHRSTQSWHYYMALLGFECMSVPS